MMKWIDHLEQNQKLESKINNSITWTLWFEKSSNKHNGKSSVCFTTWTEKNWINNNDST